MEQIVQENEKTKYIFIFYGSAPSIVMARVAYRRVGKRDPPKPSNRKVLKCPYCSFPFTDADAETKVDLFCYPARKQVRCQFYPVCQNCGNEVGIIIVAS